MTTLVWRAGVLAADSQGSRGGTVSPGAERKVWRLKDGRLVGITGSTGRYSPLVRALMDGGRGDDLPTVNSEAKVIVIETDGTVIVHEEESWYACGPAPYFAWGSGMDTALGALHMGASAKRAVEAAIAFDTNSGGPVQSVSLRKPR